MVADVVVVAVGKHELERSRLLRSVSVFDFVIVVDELVLLEPFVEVRLAVVVEPEPEPEPELELELPQ